MLPQMHYVVLPLYHLVESSYVDIYIEAKKYEVLRSKICYCTCKHNSGHKLVLCMSTDLNGKGLIASSPLLLRPLILIPSCPLPVGHATCRASGAFFGLFWQIPGLVRRAAD